MAVVAGLLGLGLVELRLKRPRADLRQGIAGVDVLALAESYLVDLSLRPAP
jgi:hypothetical protein